MDLSTVRRAKRHTVATASAIGRGPAVIGARDHSPRRRRSPPWHAAVARQQIDTATCRHRDTPDAAVRRVERSAIATMIDDAVDASISDRRAQR
ncbi:hypothetical protein ACH0AE_17910 [Sphingomonas sp. 179-A 2A2 NHS]